MTTLTNSPTPRVSRLAVVGEVVRVSGACGRVAGTARVEAVFAAATLRDTVYRVRYVDGRRRGVEVHVGQFGLVGGTA